MVEPNEHSQASSQPTPSDRQAELLLLHQELMDPATSDERLQEINQRARELTNPSETTVQPTPLSELSDKQLEALIKDASTPSYVLDEIYIITKQRAEARTLPPEE